MTNKQKQTNIKLGFVGVTSFAVANMIGTGVFTSLGFQLMDIRSPFAVLALWVVGGLIALCGSLTYGELGAAMPRSGGEYHYLSKIYHPALGFLSGFVSITIGFAAPVALACMAMGNYLAVLIKIPDTAIALVALTLITIIHLWSVRAGSRFQNLFTLFKILLIIVFVVLGLTYAPQLQNISLTPSSTSLREIISPAFAVSLIYVSYSYSGWNASAYIASEVRNPQRTLPRSLFWGVFLVMLLYVMLNYTFLKTAPINELSGQVEIGFISANHIFGNVGAGIMSALIAILLVSSISSMVFVGPRITQVMGEDILLFRPFARKNSRGVPVNAILLQFIISFLFIITGSFEQVLTYSGFILSTFTFLTVAGVFVHRRKYKTVERPYKTWGYPVVPIIFLLLTGWTMCFLIIRKTDEALLGMLTLLIGMIVYYINKLYSDKRVKNK